MSMTAKQKREYLAMQAEVARLTAELALARQNSVHAPTSTNVNDVTEDATSPSASLTTGVDPDTVSSETGPPKNINVTERASSPKASLLKGVESDTARAETVSPDNTNVTEGTIPPRASLLKGVQSDTALAETLSPYGTNVTEEAISPTASLPRKVKPATALSRARARKRVDHARSTAEEIVALQMLSNPDALLTAGVIPQGGRRGSEVLTGSIANNASGDPSVASIALGTASEEDNAVSPPKDFGGELEIFMTPASPPGSATGPPHATPSPMLLQMHTTVNALAKGLDMSSLEGLPPGYAPPPAHAGNSATKPPSPMMVPVKATPATTVGKTQDPYPSFLQSPNFLLGGAIRTLGKMKNVVGIPSKRSASSKSKNKRSAFATWSRHKVPHIVTVATGSASARKAQGDSRLSPDDSVVFTHEDEVETRPALTGGAQTSLEGGTTSDASVSPKDVVPPTSDGTPINPDDRTSPEDGTTPDVSASPRGVVPTTPDDTLTDPGNRTSPTGEGQSDPDGGLTSDIAVNRANKVPPEVQTVLSDRARMMLELEQRLSDDLEARLLAKPISPVSRPDPDPVPDPMSAPDSIEIEGFSSITHTSSSDATNPNGTPITQGTPSPLDGTAPGTGEHTAEAPRPPSSKPSNASVSPAKPKPIPLAPGTKPPPIASTSTGISGNAGTTPRSGRLYGLLPCTTPGGNESGSAQTAAQTEVESLSGPHLATPKEPPRSFPTIPPSTPPISTG